VRADAESGIHRTLRGVGHVQADPVCGWLLFLACNGGPVGKAPVVT
jgi:hypothetical protein